MVRKNQWKLSRSLNEEMDRTQDHLLQIEQRTFEIGAVESNLNCKELSYWVLTRFYEYHFKENKRKILNASVRTQRFCLKNMQKEIDELGSNIITACEKCDAFSYLTVFQQENLEKALQVFISQVQGMKRINLFVSDTSYAQWTLQQERKIEQCQKLLAKRRERLENVKE